MKNGLEALGTHTKADKNRDVATLLELIKGVTANATDRKCLPLQATKAWRQLVQAHQQQEEDLLSHCKQFVSLVDAVERNCATIQPTEMAKKNSLHKTKLDKALKAKRDKMIVALFMEGANHGFKPMMRDLANDFALRASMHSSTIEEAMEVMTVFVDQPAYKAIMMKS